MPTALHFLATVLTLIALLPGAAHLLELPRKIALDATDYLLVQQIYRGWAIFGLPLVAALIASAALAVLARSDVRLFAAAVVATVCVAATLVIFFSFTFPVNQATQNWTVVPDGWEALRARWEWSHAVNAMLMLTALIALLWPAFWPSSRP